MKYIEAWELCCQGKRIYRTGWNAKDEFVYRQKGGIVAVQELRCDAIRTWAQRNGLLTIEVAPRFDIKTAEGVLACGWFESQEDIQADDWRVLE
jgi:hypothetical protein